MFEDKEVKIFDDVTVVEIGKRIQKKRIEKGIKAIDFSEAIGIGNNQLSRIENGKAVCRVEHLFVIAQYLNVSMDYLLYGNECNEMLSKLIATISPLNDDRIAKVVKIMEIIEM